MNGSVSRRERSGVMVVRKLLLAAEFMVPVCCRFTMVVMEEWKCYCLLSVSTSVAKRRKTRMYPWRFHDDRNEGVPQTSRNWRDMLF